MKKFLSWAESVDSIVAETAAAIVCTLVVQYGFTGESELWSEFLCWCLVALAVAPLRRLRKAPAGLESSTGDDVPLWLPWIIAIGLVITSWCKSASDVRWLFPLLTPSLLAFRRYLEPGDLPSNLRSADLSLLSYVGGTLQGTSIVAVVAIISFTQSLSAQSICYALIAVIAQFVVFAGLVKLPQRSVESTSPTTIERIVVSISWRTILILAGAILAQSLAFPLPVVDYTSIALSGVLKTVRWLLVFRITQRATWDVATTIETFTYATVGGPSPWSSLIQALAYIFTSFLALGQTIVILPKSARSKWFLWAFQTAPFFLFFHQDIALRGAEQLGHLIRPHASHPIDSIIQNAQREYAAMVARQSTSFEKAHVEYIRRYHREPPHGFRDWYEFATSHDSIIIDEYDVIHDRLAPFWRMSGHEVQTSIDEAQTAPGSRLWRCNISNGALDDGCKFIGERINALLEMVRDRIPSLSLLINPLDEPSLLLPPNSPSPEQLSGEDPVRFVDISHSPSWGQLTKQCPDHTVTKRGSTRKGVDTRGLPFVQDLHASQSLCDNPEFKDMHGFLQSPTTFKFTNQAAPFLSTAAPSTMSDVLYPTTAYSDPDYKYDMVDDVDWNDKHRVLYWAGSNTGSHDARGDEWHNSHRQRFMKFVNNMEPSQYQYLEKSNRQWNMINSTYLNSTLYDVTFTDIIQCEPKQCDDQKSYFPVQERAGKNAHTNYQLNFDIDGNGLSGRFYRLLASTSLPLKQTIFREWHDDRLFPWVHYVPVSLGMQELPELVRYLTTTPDGQEQAKKMANQGRLGYNQTVREVDQTIFLYRLFLELARLQDPARIAD